MNAANPQVRRKPVPSQVNRSPVRGVTAASPSPKQQPTSSPYPPPYPDHDPPPYEATNLAVPQQKLRPSRSAQNFRSPSPHPNSVYPPVQRAATDFRPASSSSHRPLAPDPNHGPLADGSPLQAVQKAYAEARHFLGGLIARPTESTRHVTILRHSSGIVFYRGPTTSVTISIFSDALLPPERTLWLQNKGWTGKAGMKAKALFHLTDDWLEVTPALAVTAEQVAPGDERAWQRDVAKFRKKASGRQKTHLWRQTVVARVPIEAGDGYFSLVLCHGPGKKKTMCTSPVFRILSTSINPSSVRGASLSTMPLEMGALVLGMYAQSAAQTVLAPVTSAVQTRLQPYQPGMLTQTAAKEAYSLSHVGDHVSTLLSGYEGQQRAAQSRGQGQGPELAPPSLDDGPQPPFPVDFKCRAAWDLPPVWTPDAASEPPRCIIQKAPDHICDRFLGFFVVWVRFEKRGRSPVPWSAGPATPGSEDTTPVWHPGVLSIRQFDPRTQPRVQLSQTMKKTVHLRFLDEIPLPPVQDLPAMSLTLSVRIMAFLRADLPPPTGRTPAELYAAREAASEAAMLAEACDADSALGILAHPAWAVVDRDEQASWIDRTRQGLDTARHVGQRAIENVPLHWVGVRAPTVDMSHGGGFYVPR
ncbi:hypothetical protein P168DRAFT_293367 [Aspergillus campestris IBT 28561]|uniref:LipA and NB-ARC domain protein n=1 Tax=Aspergillus campestris (strain IBT 28561) TaxID=1392248 RepID=A0A2I1CS49_ASPC2|nr:uncharacterized protein P168DRAFT_293367 [Aspergillus campestris IBT 28561]PKY00454.1 hypothetical protein P168DRAFT_293367 [Aspergillus campestris IBT 28561]